MSEVEFQPWPKIARLNREITVTEKIDGTNAAVIITEDLTVSAQSRKRLITPEDDNFGFARWVHDNRVALASLLGPGRHFGEWWGSGIQRGYGLSEGEKRLSLFNTARYGNADFSELPALGVVPVLYQGQYDQRWINAALEGLSMFGSAVADGFMDPEGIIVFHSAAQQMFKVTIKGDEAPKSLAATA